MIPKVNRPEDLHAVSILLSQLELASDLETGKIKLEAQIESAEGLANADAIASATGRLEALHFGPGDFAASMSMPQTSIGVLDEWDEAYPGHRFHYAMQRIVVAARAAGAARPRRPRRRLQRRGGAAQELPASPALWASTASGASTPPRYGIVNEVFSPTEREVEWAKKVVAAYEEANADRLRLGQRRRADGRRRLHKDGAQYARQGPEEGLLSRDRGAHRSTGSVHRGASGWRRYNMDG